MIHIKRDGALLCGYNKITRRKGRSIIYVTDFISFTYAHEIDFKNGRGHYCPDCVKKYYEKVARMKAPVVVVHPQKKEATVKKPHSTPNPPRTINLDIQDPREALVAPAAPAQENSSRSGPPPPEMDPEAARLLRRIMTMFFSGY